MKDVSLANILVIYFHTYVAYFDLIFFVGVEITRDKLRAVFMDAGTADWHRVVQDFPNFNESCLIEVLMEWHSKQKCQDPWMSWRKLAALVESSKEDINDLEGDKEQLGIGYQLRLWSGVGRCILLAL